MLPYSVVMKSRITTVLGVEVFILDEETPCVLDTISQTQLPLTLEERKIQTFQFC